MARRLYKLSVFLDCFKNRGSDYLRIVHSIPFVKEDGKRSNKRTVIKNIGYLSAYDDGKGEGLLERLRTKFRNETFDIGMDYKDLPVQVKKETKLTIKNPEPVLNEKNIGYIFIENIFNKLGVSEIIRRYKSDNKLDYDILGIVKLLVFGRVLDPKSKKATFEKRDKYLFPVTTSEDLNEMYKALDVLYEKSESIQKRMNTKIQNSSVGRDAAITYYDVTNYFFETHYPDADVYKLDEENKIVYEDGKPVVLEKGFRKNGTCKKHSGKPLVSMGLFLDSNNIPVAFKVFPGNTHESTGFKEIIIPTLNNKNLGKVILVADNGMYDQKAQMLLVTNGNGYIISKSVKESWHTKPKGEGSKTLREWALEDADYEKEFDENNNLLFKSKSRVYSRTLKDGEGNSITIKEKQVLTWSINYYRKNLHEYEKLEEELEFYKNNPKMLLQIKKKYKKFVKVLQVEEKTGEIINPTDVAVLIDKKIQKEKEILGYYSRITSETELDDLEIIRKHQGLSRIEDSFRIIRRDLEGRPVYVWTPEHITAHFLICYIALTVVRIMQYKVLKYQGKDPADTADGWEQGITAEKIKETLANFKANHIGDGFHQVSEVNEYMKTITQAFGINIDLCFPDLSKIAGLKDKVATIDL